MIVCKPVNRALVIELVEKYHYAKVMPQAHLTKHHLGFYRENTLIGVLTLGWGVRPLHTIRKLFPSLAAKDHLEIGKFCLRDEEPRNTESECLALTIRWVKKNRPDVRVLFTWADGFRGKPGYIYQASNFLYGGFIWSDRYVDSRGAFIHPRALKASGWYGIRDGKKVGRRPKVDEEENLGIRRYWGKQFRYIFLLCNHREQKKLLKETTVAWVRKYPKNIDLAWKTPQNVEGKIRRKLIFCPSPNFTQEVQVMGGDGNHEGVCTPQKVN